MRQLIDEPPASIVPKRIRPEGFVEPVSTESTGSSGPSLNVLIRLPEISNKSPRSLVSRAREMKPAAIASLTTGVRTLRRRPKLVGTVGVGLVVALAAFVFLPSNEKPVTSEAPAWTGKSRQVLVPHTADKGGETHVQHEHDTELGHSVSIGEDDAATSAADADRPLRIKLEEADSGSGTRSAANVPGHLSQVDSSWSDPRNDSRDQSVDPSPPELPRISYPSPSSSGTISIAKNSVANTAGRIGSSQGQKIVQQGNPITDPLVVSPSMQSTAPSQSTSSTAAAEGSSLGIPRRIVKRLVSRNSTPIQGLGVKPPSEAYYERPRSRVY